LNFFWYHSDAYIKRTYYRHILFKLKPCNNVVRYIWLRNEIYLLSTHFILSSLQPEASEEVRPPPQPPPIGLSVDDTTTGLRTARWRVRYESRVGKGAWRQLRVVGGGWIHQNKPLMHLARRTYIKRIIILYKNSVLR